MMSRFAARVDERRQLLPLMAAMCATLVASHVRGDADERVRLSWIAPAGCPRVEDVRARMDKLIGHAPADGATIRAEATVVRTPSGRLHLTLIVHTADSVGQREIEASACDDLAGATAVNLALLLRSVQPPTAATREAASQSSAGAELAQPSTSLARSASNARARTPSDADQPKASEPLAALERSPRTWRGLLRLPLMAASIGPLPSASWGAALAIGLQIERWSIYMDGGAWLRQSLPATELLDVTAHVDRMELGLAACHGFSFGAVELAPCAVLSLEHVWTRGAGAHITARTAQATWLAPGIGGQTRWLVTSWLALAASIHVQAQTARPNIAVDGVGRIGHFGPLALTFLLGSEWIL